MPSGAWAEGSAVTDDVIAIATWPRNEIDRAEPRWRLVVAARRTGELLFDDRVGDMNVVEMFAAPSGEVMIVEPLRSHDWNFGDGFVLHGYDPDRGDVREAARFDDGELNLTSVTLLSNGHLGIVGAERNGDVFDRFRLVVFDWQRNEAVTDVVVEGLPLEADVPDGVFVEPLGHETIWDEERDRAVIVHAHEDVATTVDITTGDIDRVALVEDRSVVQGLLSWLVPAAHAKGLPGSRRHAVVSGGHLYVAGQALTVDDDGTRRSSQAYAVQPTDLLKIDLDTLRIVDRGRPGVTAVAGSPEGGYLVGGGATVTGHAGPRDSTIAGEEHSGLVVIDPDTLQVVSRRDEVHVTSPHEMRFSPADGLVHVQVPDQAILSVDPASGHVARSGTKWFEPSVVKNSLWYAAREDPE